MEVVDLLPLTGFILRLAADGDHNWQDHRSALGLIIQELSDLVPNDGFYVIRLHLAVIRNSSENIPQALSNFVQDCAVFFEINKSAGNDIRIFD